MSQFFDPGRAGGSLVPSSDAAAAALVAHSVAASRSASALHDVVQQGEARAGRALLAVTAAGGSALAAAVVHLAALESAIGGVFPGVRASAASIRDCDAAVLAALRRRSIQTIPDVLAMMDAIDAELPDGDGLKWFNQLYRLVTEGVSKRVPEQWERPAWLDRLDVIFAELYFSGVEACLAAPGRGPLAWRALLDVRCDPRIAPLQFALAGMSAHINRDLAVAVARTWASEGTVLRRRDTPEFRDFRRVDQLLDAVEPKAMQLLASGLVESLDRIVGDRADWTALQILHGARDIAWSQAEALDVLQVESSSAVGYVDGLDVIAAGCARAALIPLG